MRPSQLALEAVLREHAIRTGNFTLASGRTSTWYLDARQVTFRGDCLSVVGDAIVDALEAAGAPQFEAVGGLAVGAVPVALAVAAATKTRSFAVRKEAKSHGTGGRIAGPLTPEDRVLIVEDTATSGGSLLDAVDAVLEFGCEIIGATVLLDRGGEVGAKLAERNIAFYPVLTAPDLGFAFGS